MPPIIYEYETETGELIFIEASDPSQSAAAPGMRGGRGGRQEEASEVRRVKISFEKALGTVKAAANGLKQVINDTAPDEAKVEFSLKATGEAGLFTICRAETAAEFKITLTWKTPDTSNA